LKVIKQNTLLKVLSLNSISVAVSFVLGIFSSKIISVFLGTSGMALTGSFRNFALMIKSVATLGINNSIVKLFIVVLVQLQVELLQGQVQWCFGSKVQYPPF
jgi:PST family polysaccharide transporter